MVRFISINTDISAVKLIVQKPIVPFFKDRYILFDNNPQFVDRDIQTDLIYNNEVLNNIIFSQYEIKTILPNISNYFIPLTQIFMFKKYTGIYKKRYKSLFIEESPLGIVIVKKEISDLYDSLTIEAKYKLFEL